MHCMSRGYSPLVVKNITALEFGLASVISEGKLESLQMVVQGQIINYAQLRKVPIFFQNSLYCYYLLDNIREFGAFISVIWHHSCS